MDDLSWCRAPGTVLQVWSSYGIMTPVDLVSFYVSDEEVREDLVANGVPHEAAMRGVAAWRDASRAARLQPASSSTPVPAAAVLPRPPDIRKGGKPWLNAPSSWSKQRSKVEGPGSSQGLHAATLQHLQASWDILLRAKAWSTVWPASPHDSDVATIRILFCRPLERFADSLHTRLRAWRRWERWLVSEGSDVSPFFP